MARDTLDFLWAVKGRLKKVKDLTVSGNRRLKNLIDELKQEQSEKHRYERLYMECKLTQQNQLNNLTLQALHALELQRQINKMKKENKEKKMMEKAKVDSMMQEQQKQFQADLETWDRKVAKKNSEIDMLKMQIKELNLSNQKALKEQAKLMSETFERQSEAFKKDYKKNIQKYFDEMSKLRKLENEARQDAENMSAELAKLEYKYRDYKNEAEYQLDEHKNDAKRHTEKILSLENEIKELKQSAAEFRNKVDMVATLNPTLDDEDGEVYADTVEDTDDLLNENDLMKTVDPNFA